MKRKRNQYSTTLDDELAKDFEKCLKITGLEPAALLKEAVRAFTDEVKAKGGIWLPLAIVPAKKSELPSSPVSPSVAQREAQRLNEEGTQSVEAHPRGPRAARAALRGLEKKEKQ